MDIPITSSIPTQVTSGRYRANCPILLTLFRGEGGNRRGDPPAVFEAGVEIDVPEPPAGYWYGVQVETSYRRFGDGVLSEADVPEGK